ncbi:MAG: nickel insertion protein [Bacteroidales bacterium]
MKFYNPENFKIEKTAYGIGHKMSEVPNVLRVYWGGFSNDPTGPHYGISVECNIDDMNPGNTESVMDNLFSIGVDDVFITPIIMKKTRNGSKLSVLCSTDLKE